MFYVEYVEYTWIVHVIWIHTPLNTPVVQKYIIALYSLVEGQKSNVYMQAYTHKPMRMCV